jgi:hypothetical protein
MGLGQIDLWELMETLIMLLGLDFMPLDQIGHMSLNGLRRRVATRDKTQTETRMDEPSVALDLKHGFQLVGPLCYHFIDRKTVCWSISTLGFFSMRHSAISEEEVDFQEHYVGIFWVV